jgi:hypothetical protein
MSTHAPPGKEKPPPDGKGIGKLTTIAKHQALVILQAPFAFMFWLIEQRKARLQYQLHNEGCWR